MTNLKERIAALEQRNSGVSGASRATSPTPSTVTVAGATAPGFRDKIAKFERKGGVPVPRGSFGMGAPPPSEGPRRRRELYGNRIPAPARAFSGTNLPDASRASSPTFSDSLGFGLPGSSPTSTVGDRRSVSLSSVMSDDVKDYTPISSPTFAFPPDSPESVLSTGSTPEASPSLTAIGDVPAFNKVIVRGTSFQKAMEIARNAEIAKLEPDDHITAEPIQRQFTGNARPISDFEAEPVPNISISTDVPAADPAVTPVESVPSPTDTIHGDHPDRQPEVLESTSLVEAQKEPAVVDQQEFVGPQILPVIPLTIRKRRPTNPAPPSVMDAAVDEPPLPLIEVAPVVVVHAPVPSSEAAERPFSEPASTPTVVVHAPEIISTSISNSTVVDRDGSSVNPTTYAPSNVNQSKALPSHYESTPEITVSQDLKQDNVSIEFSSRKAALSLDPKLLAEESVDSPLDTGNTSSMSLTDMLGDYFTAARPATPPSRPLASPMSPYATLAYDAPESPEKESQGKPAAIDVDGAQAFLSPPLNTGHRASAPSSGGSSLGSLSSLGSRPMSMIETANHTQVSRAMRMTPATGRGVPMFFPPTSAAPRKSDFVYFPPTPDQDEFGVASRSATTHKATQSLSLDSRQWAEGSAPEPQLEHNVTFTAVVHDKVSDVPPPPMGSRQQRQVPETPQMKRTKRMTMMEPPPSPANGELAALLQEAVLLEDSLDRGELPTEAWVRLDAEENQRKEDAAVAAAAALVRQAEDEERQRIAAAAARLQAKRDQPTSGRLKHTFLVPLSKARSVAHRKEVSAPEPPPKTDDEHLRPKSAGAPGRSATLPSTKSLSSQRPVTPENNVPMQQQQHLETPPKSAKTSRFVGFRRLGSISARPTTIHGHSTRTSVSTMSSDSTNVLTPPEGALEFTGSRKSSSVNEFGSLTANDSTTSFPSLSPKKSSASIGRAASFAERVFSRTRTKSSGSNLSSTSEMTGMFDKLT